MSASVSVEEALIFTMVIASAVDNQMSDPELGHIGKLVKSLPVFSRFEATRLLDVSQECTLLVSGPLGLDGVLLVIRDALPERLYDTAYALAVEVASADLKVRPEELRLLSRLRDTFGLDKLTCAAIERSAIARYRKG
ncbi:tellurite resistance TerB family protein [Gellertiella hungarica]|uniref:Tellurite resistance protein n=1 Tax=Gellertiella hungarica TaxID=1572859 RepID=A0A7W6NJW8_9HYPH|nr:tellurite resistance TerB family protein [Gellertiella hungarica]MBB4063909.1 tellurite resistance protein [Gellertiella hungarica]